MVAAQKQRVELAEPAFQLDKTRAVFARLDFGDERSGFAAERIDIDVVAAAAELAGAGQRVALGVNVECSCGDRRSRVPRDLPFDDA